MKEVIEYVKNIRLLLESERESIELPFFNNFPVNSCEGASFLLALFMSEKFPKLSIEVIHGQDETGYENHFWIEADGLVYDITCDQFDEMGLPIYALPDHPMANHFTVMEKFSVPLFLVRSLKELGLTTEKWWKVYLHIKKFLK